MRVTVLRAFGQVADLLQALTHDQLAHDADARALTAAEADLKLAQSGFNAGGLGLLPVIERGAHLSPSCSDVSSRSTPKPIWT